METFHWLELQFWSKRNLFFPSTIPVSHDDKAEHGDLLSLTVPWSILILVSVFTSRSGTQTCSPSHPSMCVTAALQLLRLLSDPTPAPLSCGLSVPEGEDRMLQSALPSLVYSIHPREDLISKLTYGHSEQVPEEHRKGLQCVDFHQLMQKDSWRRITVECS
jgi:hypothetical protein